VSVENGLMAALIAVVLFLTMTDASARLPGLSFVSDHQVSRGF
jgi:Flp pilus assembly pilin Flp